MVLTAIIFGVLALNLAVWAILLVVKTKRLRAFTNLCEERWYFLCLTHEVLVEQAELQSKFHRVLMDYEGRRSRG